MSFLDQLFANLTKSGVQDPNSGQTQYFPNQAAAGIGQAQLAAKQAQPDSMQFGDQGVSTQTPQIQSPQQVKPSFTQASHNSLGMPDATGPGLNKAGKLLTVLFSGLAGAAAGGGQRTLGEGFQSGAQLPFMQAYQKQQLQRGSLQNQQTEQQLKYQPMLQKLGLSKAQADIAQTQAGTAHTQAETSAMPSETALREAQTLAARYKEDPASGALIDLQTMQPVNGGQMIPVQTPELAKVLNVPVGTQVPLARAAKAADFLTKGNSTINTEEGVFRYNDITGDRKKLGTNPRNIFAPENKIIPAAVDPNDPGKLTYVKAGTAMNNGAQAPGSAPVQASKKTLESATSGPIGNEINANNTAIAHADLLIAAAKALQNGDNQTLAGLKNQFKNEFGYEGPITASAIADTYTHEVQKMLSGGHMTDAEIGRVGKTIDPTKQNLATISSVVGAYKSLAQSKLQQRKNQVDKGMQGKPNFPDQGGQEIHYTIVNGQLVAQ